MKKSVRNEHGFCKKCGVSFDGGFIWDTGYDFAVTGKHYIQRGEPARTKEEVYRLADEYAKAYGADRYSGRWGLQIGIEIPSKYDGTSYWKCHACGYTWDRFTGLEVILESEEWRCGYGAC